MNRQSQILNTVLQELKSRNVRYAIENGKKHIKVKFKNKDGVPSMTVVSRSPSDHHAIKNAQKQIIRMLE